MSTTSILTILGHLDLHQPHPTDRHLEEADGQLRQLLGLRPHMVDDGVGGTKGAHPDQRGCPTWCWVASSDHYDHSASETLLEAMHSMEGTPRILLEDFPVAVAGSVEDGYYQGATLEPRLEQLGQSEARIRVARRTRESYADEFLDLSLSAAEELARVLTFLVDTARQG